MHIVLVTPVPLLADSLRSAVEAKDDTATIHAVSSLAELRQGIDLSSIDAVLLDVTQGIDRYELSRLAPELSRVKLWGFGPECRLRELKKIAPGMFTGYLSRALSIETLCQMLAAPADKNLTPSRQWCADSQRHPILRFLCRLSPFRRGKSGRVKSR